MGEHTIIDYAFNKSASIIVDKEVVKKRITSLTTNGTLENNQIVIKILSELKTRKSWQ